MTDLWNLARQVDRANQEFSLWALAAFGVRIVPQPCVCRDLGDQGIDIDGFVYKRSVGYLMDLFDERERRWLNRRFYDTPNQIQKLSREMDGRERVLYKGGTLEAGNTAREP